MVSRYFSCRLCLKEKNVVVDCIKNPDINKQIFEKFKIQIHENDKFTRKICRNCFIKINEYSLYEETININQKIFEMYKNLDSQANIKQEEDTATNIDNEEPESLEEDPMTVVYLNAIENDLYRNFITENSNITENGNITENPIDNAIENNLNNNTTEDEIIENIETNVNINTIENELIHTQAEKIDEYFKVGKKRNLSVPQPNKTKKIKVFLQSINEEDFCNLKSSSTTNEDVNINPSTSKENNTSNKKISELHVKEGDLNSPKNTEIIENNDFSDSTKSFKSKLIKKRGRKKEKNIKKPYNWESKKATKNEKVKSDNNKDGTSNQPGNPESHRIGPNERIKINMKKSNGNRLTVTKTNSVNNNEKLDIGVENNEKKVDKRLRKRNY